MAEEKIREVRILRQVPVKWADLRKGDIFRTLPASDGDTLAEENTWNLAVSDGFVGNSNQRFVVRSEPILDKISNFHPDVIKDLESVK